MIVFDELWQLISSVWSPATVATATIAGLALGFFVLGYLARLPAYANTASPGQVGRLVALGSGLSGLVFYVGQAAAASTEGDPGTERVVSRFGLWVLYSLAMGLGIWARLRIEQHRHRLAVHVQAVHELEER